MTYRDVYVAQVAIGADPQQAVRAMLEAESYAGPSLVLAYSQCVVQGINMTTAMSHQKQIVQCGLWPLYRFDPRRTASGLRAMQLDCEAPKLPFKAFAMTEARFALLAHSNPDHARQLFEQAQQDIKDPVERAFRDVSIPRRGNKHVCHGLPPNPSSTWTAVPGRQAVQLEKRPYQICGTRALPARLGTVVTPYGTVAPSRSKPWHTRDVRRSRGAR